MTAKIIPFVPTGDQAPQAAPGIRSAVRLLVNHARLDAAAAAGGNVERQARLVRMQGETMLLAALVLLDESGSL